MSRLVAFVLVLLAPSLVEAQDAIVLRPDARIGAMSGPIVTGLERRTQRSVAIDGVLDDATPRDLGGPIGLALVGDRVRMFAVAPSGALHVTEVGAASDDRTTARVIVVALTGFLESLASDVDTSVIAPEPVIEEYELPIDGSALDDLARPYRVQSFEPMPVLELRERAGYSTQRDEGTNWIGGSAGVCLGTWWCLELDVDAMLPSRDQALAYGGVTYESVAVGVGGRFLPLEAGPVRGGVGLDALVRVSPLAVSSATAPDGALHDVAVSGGARLLIDLAIAIVRPVYLAIEAGADLAFNAARFRRAATTLLTEDVVTLWAAIAIRVAPPF